MMFAGLAERLASVREEIARVQAAEGLKQDVAIVGVTKGHPVDAVRAAYQAGLADVGENRVQEGLEKHESAAGIPVQWHLIGHLQTNKAKQVAGVFALVHSVDSWRVAEALAVAAEKKGDGPPPGLLPVKP